MPNKKKVITKTAVAAKKTGGVTKKSTAKKRPTTPLAVSPSVTSKKSSTNAPLATRPSGLRQIPPVDYKKQMVAAGFSARQKHSATTYYPANPVFLANQTVENNSFLKKLASQTMRGKMSNNFTQDLVDEDYNDDNPYRDYYLQAGSLKSAGVARIHRLADSSIRSILLESLFNFDKKNLRHKSALRMFFAALGSGQKGYGSFMRAVKEAYASNPNLNHTRANLNEAIAATSINTRNVTFGNAEINERIANSFDPHLDAHGNMTPITLSIHDAVEGLYTAGLISEELFDATTTQATDIATNEGLSSTEEW